VVNKWLLLCFDGTGEDGVNRIRLRANAPLRNRDASVTGDPGKAGPPRPNTLGERRCTTPKSRVRGL
jgi:hypothetical protein